MYVCTQRGEERGYKAPEPEHEPQHIPEHESEQESEPELEREYESKHEPEGFYRNPGHGERGERLNGWGNEEPKSADATAVDEPATTNDDTTDDEPAAASHEPAATDDEHPATDDEPAAVAANDDGAANAAAEPGLGQPGRRTAQAVEPGEGGRRRRKERRRRRRRRRGSRRKKQEKETTTISIVLTNCKGYSSKEESIRKDIVEQLAPDVLLINETLLTGPRQIKSKDYLVYCKNRQEKDKEEKERKGGEGAGGGVATLISKQLQASTIKAGEGRQGDEYIITRLSHVRPALNIVNIYGENENRAGHMKILESWIRLKEDLAEINGRGEHILIFGDMNRQIGADEFGVKGNKGNISTGGQLIRELLKTKEFVLLNNLPLTTGGPFTWVQPGKEEVRSCLDLAIASASLVPFVKTMTIDSERKFTPRRVTRKAGKAVTVYTDHFSVLLKLEGLPSKKVKPEKVTSWNLLKPGSWDKYKKLTKEAAKNVKKVAENMNFNANEAMKRLEVIDDAIKFKAFGKTKPKTQKKVAIKKKVNADDLLDAQSKRVEEEILKVEKEDKSKVNRG